MTLNESRHEAALKREEEVAALRAAGYGQKQVARMLGVSQSRISQIERRHAARIR